MDATDAVRSSPHSTSWSDISFILYRELKPSGINMSKRRPLNKHLRVQVLARDKYRCLMCGRSTKDEVSLEVDHVVAVTQGGTDELSNLATLCRDCNAGKSNYHFTDYRAISVIPSELADHFKFFKDSPTGDFLKYHLYLYVKDGIHPGTTDFKFHHTWEISGTTSDTSSNQSRL